jgi:hypothetical protein
MTSVGTHPAQLYGSNEEGEDVRLAGVTIEVSPSRAPEVVRDLRSRMPAGYMTFVRDQSFGIAGKPDLVAAMKAADMYAVIAALGTNGWNYDIGPKHIIERLKDWDRRYGLTLTGAGFDWLGAEFVHPPADMPAFAAEVYRFCPDVVDQGTETVEALGEEMRRTNSVYLWWD